MTTTIATYEARIADLEREQESIHTLLLSIGGNLTELGRAVQRVRATDDNTQALLEISVLHANALGSLAQALTISIGDGESPQGVEPVRGRVINAGVRFRPVPRVVMPIDQEIEQLADGEREP